MKSFGTRLDDDLAAALGRAAAFTGLRPADLLRFGAKMVIDSIKDHGGLVLANGTTPRPARRRRKSTAA